MMIAVFAVLLAVTLSRPFNGTGAITTAAAIFGIVFTAITIYLKRKMRQ
jgi:hypothetical protein